MTVEGRAAPILLPAEFVTGRKADGRPQVSHSWARTIDGVQGGTWDQVHLLATPALDRYRGYVGQSRSIQPTHTWNTQPRMLDDPGDHGRRLVQTYSTPAEQIAAALARAQPKTFAAADDPHRSERSLRSEQAAHRKHLDQRSPDVTDHLRRAEQEVSARQRDLQDAQERLAHWQEQRDQTSGLRGLTKWRREQRHLAVKEVQFQGRTIEREAQRLDAARREHEDLLGRQAAGIAFDQDNQWRVQRITALEHQVDLRWAEAVLDAARDGYPAAYGKQRLQSARQAIVDQIETLADRPSRSQPHQPDGRLDDPMRDLADLDRAIVQAAQQPDLKLVEPIKPRRHRMDRWPQDTHYQHRLQEQIHRSDGPSIGIEL